MLLGSRNGVPSQDLRKTSDYGSVPKDAVSMCDVTMEPWFFGEIPTGIAVAVLREQAPGCFMLRRLSDSIILSFRAELTVKHVQVVLDESSQNYRIKDESDSVSYANFLQFETIQQLVDQYRHNPSLGVKLDKYPTVQNIEEIWRVDSNDVTNGDEIVSTLPWAISHGKFRDKHSLLHTLRDNSSNDVKEKFINHARILMTLNHENVVHLHGLCMKNSRLLVIQSYLPKGNLSSYLSRNASLLLLHPSEMVNIARQVLTGMAYLEESGIVHGELVAENCLVGDNGRVKISGFHCARSSWCCDPLNDDDYVTRVAITPPEVKYQEPSSQSDIWAYGLLVYTIITAGQKPTRDLREVLRLEGVEGILDQLEGITDVMTLCLRTDPAARPTFSQLHQRSCNRGRIQSTPSVSSSCTPEDSLSLSNGLITNGVSSSDTPVIPRQTREAITSPELIELEEFLPPNWRKSLTESIVCKMNSGIENDNILESLKMAEFAALKAKALQKRAEAEKEQVLTNVGVAELKCLREVEFITKTLVARLTEAHDRAEEAEHSRYSAEEMKRSTEEKFTLYKYETERKLHDMKVSLDEVTLERDEFMSSLRALGIEEGTDERRSDSGSRRNSLQRLDDKYQRYIATSDRTIQNMKYQLNEVSNQRDAIIEERDYALLDAKEARELLEEVLKEKEDLGFRLEESNCEIERLEETISMMMQKRQKAERERDQLQILTDLSLMKLRQAEKPKKRHSVSGLSSPRDDREREWRERRDPNLRRLSMQLMNLMTPTSSQRRDSTDTIYETSEVSSSDEAAFSSRAGSEDEGRAYFGMSRGRRHGRAGKSPLSQLKEITIHERSTSPRSSDNESDMTKSTDVLNGGFSDSEEQKEKSESEQEDDTDSIPRLRFRANETKSSSVSQSMQNKKMYRTETNTPPVAHSSPNEGGSQLDQDTSNSTPIDDLSENDVDPSNTGHGSDAEHCTQRKESNTIITDTDMKNELTQMGHKPLARTCYGIRGTEFVIKHKHLTASKSELPRSEPAVEEHKPLALSSSLPFPIPTLRIEEVNDDAVEVVQVEGVPQIAISLIDENDNLNEKLVDGQEERSFVVGTTAASHEINTRMVYSFDDDAGSVKRVPQTTL
ncbi:uncharacterized protein LOC5521937 isoform X2 [Nematostella vectensis]|uniref:uncharacterized protein LOC5521937 isoform X2 n=1 Tax=Nematostella vectensis TaxID=45351 RepID=UPI0020771730|nr:uncharacterized protein LOC5521937 isoform X2 [Nematostella vectensis]XP_048589419.1 uncharacterized protein LOC5521937 isoform X2 [Nematostella vectensis]